ncbi:MAG: 16S rRNA (cytosine(1402)-N(4))-methyltransferase, partial [Chlamydiia bacterium]|nr:16S rRNA (cytosine(1402)-N(4))-methyltransferase [Chlamydiia bacterium]
MQLDEKGRGFSFLKEGPLDMRMDPSSNLTAKEIVNKWSEKDLGKLFQEYGEERQWRKAARAIVEARRKKTIET